MAIGQSSPYASPLSYSTPMTSTPTTASILGSMPSYSQGIQALSMQPMASAAPESSLLLDSLMGFSRGMNQPQEQLQTTLRPQMQQYNLSPTANLLGGLDMSILNQVLQQPMMAQQPTLLDYIQLLGGQV